jgi:NAD(P)-dependent dehydrogenase (short-subunit alcohol dehydrogenase family)
MSMNPPVADWRGRHVWIIGASTGIGAATARLLLARGAHVMLSARRQAVLDALLDDAQRGAPGGEGGLDGNISGGTSGGSSGGISGGISGAIALDVTDADSVQRACAEVLARWPRIDLVLLLAGGYNEMRADSFDLAAANGLIDLNVRGVFNCLAPLLPMLLRQGTGGIGIVASVAGFGGLPKALVYGPTKAALINLSESLYFDLRPRGIAVYQINPGFVDTPLTANNDFAMPALMTADAAARALLRGLERGRFHIHFPLRFTNGLRLARLLPYRLYFWLISKVTRL